MGKMQGKEGTSIQGFINYKLVKKNGTVVAEKHNTITMGFKRWLHNKGAGSLFEGNNWSKGRHFVFDSLVGTQPSYSTEGVNERVYGPWGLTLGLLNLGAQEQSNLDEQSTFINIFDNTNGVNSSKLIGKCSNSVNGAVSTNKGKTQKVDETYLLDGAVNSRQWLFDEGVATGTIDTIAMMPGGMNNEIKIPAGGVRSAVELDDYNRCISGSFVSGTTKFLPPGIEGFTGTNKIFLNYENADGARHSYNITTGETDDAPTTFIVPDYPWIDYIVGTNYIYVIQRNDTTLKEVPGRGEIYLYVYNKSDMSVVNYTRGDAYGHICRLIAISGNVYVQYWEGGSTVALSKITVSGSSVSLDAVSDMSTLITIPAVLSGQRYMLGMCNSNYVLYIPQYMNTSGGTDKSSVERAGLFTGLIFTNLSDPLGSVVDSIPNLRFNSCLMHNGTNYWIADIINTYKVSDNYIGDLDSTGKFKDLEGMAFAQISDDNGAAFVYNDRNITYDQMFLMSGVGDWTSLFSFVVLDEPITKASSDKLYITYGYKIQGATLTVPIASSVSTISDSGVTS